MGNGMTIEEFLRLYWPMIFTGLGIVIWAVRVEAMLKQVAKEVADMKTQRREDLEDTVASRREVHETLAVIQEDIKKLLVQSGQRAGR